jgi:hypothetical protein
VHGETECRSNRDDDYGDQDVHQHDNEIPVS